MVKIAEAFDMLDTNDDKKIQRDEFKKAIARLQIHDPKGSAEGWKDDVFNKFDVDGKGEVDYTEFCFAVAQTAYASAATGREVSAIDLLKEVISATQQAQTEAKNEIAMPKEGAKDEYAVMDQRNSLARSADVDALHDKTSLDDWYDSIGAVVTVALCPCHLWCSVIGQSSCAGAAGSGTHLMGLANVVGYITTCKEANATYYWSIQNYHYETHVVTTQDANGNTQTRTEQRRVNTHFASTTGTLRCTDQSALFVPNMRKRNCALGSELQVGFSGDAATGEFGAHYNRQKQLFYAANTRDTHQDRSECFELPPMKARVRCEWADDGKSDPWWMNGCAMVGSTLTCTAVCWFLGARNFMCSEQFRFNKLAFGFA